jgi:hypothetical protein
MYPNAFSSGAAAIFRHRLRVRYGEIDSQAVLFNARYLDYVDIAITEYFRGLGISFHRSLPVTRSRQPLNQARRGGVSPSWPLWP